MGAFEKLCKTASRKHHIPHPAVENSSNSSPSIDMAKVRAFQREYACAEDYASKYKVLRDHWKLVSAEAFPDNSLQEVLSAIIGYRLVKEAYELAKWPVPGCIDKNLAALESNDFSALTPNMSRMMSILVQTENKRGESKMAKKEEGKLKQKQGVSQYYLEVFEGQAKAKLTDQQIADVIESKTSVAPTAKNISSYRCMYNAGELQGQKTVPASKIKAIRPPSAAKPKKPMSEETKAKLKAYTAAKKAKTAKKTKLTIKKK